MMYWKAYVKIGNQSRWIGPIRAYNSNEARHIFESQYGIGNVANVTQDLHAH